MPAPSTPAIIVVNYGSSDLLRANLADVSARLHVLNGLDTRIVVVDNPTTAAERQAVEALAAAEGWLVETPEANLGFGGGVNLGARTAIRHGASSLIMLNPDAVVTADAVAALTRAVEQDPMRMVAPVVTTSDGEIWFEGAGLDVNSGQMVSKDRLGESGIEPWLSGACLAVSVELWDRVGGFDEDFFLYWEDVDLSRRVREAGGRLAVLPEITVIHDEGGTHEDRTGGRAKSDTYYFYNVRNRMLFAHRHLTPRYQRRWLRSSPAAAWEVLLRGGRRQFLKSRGPLLVAGAAMIDGARDRVGPRGQARPAALTGPGTAHPTNTASPGSAPLNVLMTYIEPLPFHNPYVKMLDNAVSATGDVELHHFTWRRALFGRVDVVHAHWPEDVLEATTPLKGAVKRLCLGLLLLRLRAQRIPIVRTVHNLELPSGMDPAKKAVLIAFDRFTTDKILISDTTPVPAEPHRVVLHGDYTDWYSEFEHASVIPGRIAYFGMVRRYKNVAQLARAFAATRQSHPEWSLHIAGNPSSQDLVDEIEREVGSDPRVTTVLRYLEDAELVAAASSAELVVLPYKEMHNSGSLLAALSLHRPVLVPDNAANRAIATEVGPGWVFTYVGELDAEDLERAMGELRRRKSSQPDLGRRDWAGAGLDHVAFYREAVERASQR